MREIWKCVKGWPYEVSSLGRVRRDSRFLYNNSKADGILKQSFRRDYAYVSLCKNNKRVKFTVAFLAASAFHGRRPKGYVCAHNNGKPSDNRAHNLRWATPKENEFDKISHGSKIYGRKHPLSKLSDKKVIRIKKLLREKKMTHLQIASRYGVNKSKISHINTGLSWKHI